MFGRVGRTWTLPEGELMPQTGDFVVLTIRYQIPESHGKPEIAGALRLTPGLAPGSGLNTSPIPPAKPGVLAQPAPVI